ncbi:MAG: hypothetical protein WD716_11115 [Fimbriimonadaceae bacterium]
MEGVILCHPHLANHVKRMMRLEVWALPNMSVTALFAVSTQNDTSIGSS